MSDYGRTGGSAYRSRERYGRDFDREDRGRGDSIFGYGRDRDRHEDRGGGHRDNWPGGWLGDGRTSDYDDRGRESSAKRGGRSADWNMDRGGSSQAGRGFGPDDYRDELPRDETRRLIASNKVEGTPVYGRDGERLGSIYNFMVDKSSGQVEYAVMGHGGFLGMGQRYYPLPWRTLSYDTREGGYRVDLRERDLERAPSFGRDDEPEFSDNYGRKVHGWYGLSY